MRFLAPDELPEEAGRAVGQYLTEAGVGSPAWTVSHLWENGQHPAGYALTVERDGQRRAFTVMPADGGGFDVVEVTSR